MNNFSSVGTARNPYNVKIVSRISRGAAGKGNLTDPEQRQASDAAEAQLIEKARQGDAHAFQALYEKHKRRVYSLCLRMTSNTAEAEDLTQEAFLQLFRKIATFRGESAFSTWLHRLTVNLVLNSRKSEGRQRSRFEENDDEMGGMDALQLNSVSWMVVRDVCAEAMLRNGARPVPVPSRNRVRPGRKLSITSVPVGLRPTRISSPSRRCWRREVSGPSGTLIEKPTGEA